MMKFSVVQNFIFMASFDKSQWYVLTCQVRFIMLVIENKFSCSPLKNVKLCAGLMKASKFENCMRSHTRMPTLVMNCAIPEGQ